MIVDKPSWIRHDDDQPIFSIDVHPSCRRLATCGQDQKIRIWNMEPILDTAAESNPSVPKVLATLADTHIGAVNIVRFSRNGKYLASGADDSLVCIHQLLLGKGKAVFGSGDAPNVENWKLLHTSRGHSNNVMDLAWSVDDKWLASASLDNMVIVWDTSTGKKLVTLEGHNGFVKGVAWDPMGKYLASQGDDGVIIWRCEDWHMVSKLTDPPLGTNLTLNFHLRLCWTPDGQHLAAVNCYDKPAHLCTLFRRNNWTQESSLVGHRMPVCVVRYNPKMFYDHRDPNNRDVIHACAAIGSHDKQFSVWIPGVAAQPRMVGEEFFKSGVMDLVWSPDGYALFVSSYDGTVAVARFSERELGIAAPDHEVQSLLSQLYGDQRLTSKILVENPEQLNREEADRNPPAATKHLDKLNSRLMPTATAEKLNGPQREKARVGPALAAMNGLEGANGNGTVRRVTPQPAPVAGQPVAASAVAAAQQRVKPVAVQLSDGANGTAGPSSAGEGTGVLGKRSAPEAGTSGRLQGDGAPAKRLAAAPVQDARPSQQLAAQVANGTTGNGTIGNGTIGSGTAGRLSGPPITSAADSSGERVALPAARPVQLLSAQLGSRETGESSSSKPVLLEVKNSSQGGNQRAVAHLRCTCGQKILWEDELEGHVSSVVGTKNFAAVVTGRGDLQIYTVGGRRWYPLLKVGSAPAFMCADGGWRLLLVTADGRVRLWDWQVGESILETSLAPILNGTKEVTCVRLSTHGLPLAILSNQQCFAFHMGLKSWTVVTSSSFPASPHHSTMVPPNASELTRLMVSAASATRQPLHLLQTRSAQGGAAADMQTRAHLESNMASALSLKIPADYKRWLVTYVRHLASVGDEVRLREVLEDMLGPPSWTPSTHPSHAPGCWQPTILGLDKRRLLTTELLPAVGRYRSLQRLVSDFQDMLRVAEQRCAPQPQQHAAKSTQGEAANTAANPAANAAANSAANTAANPAANTIANQAACQSSTPEPWTHPSSYTSYNSPPPWPHPYPPPYPYAPSYHPHPYPLWPYPQHPGPLGNSPSLPSGPASSSHTDVPPPVLPPPYPYPMPPPVSNMYPSSNPGQSSVPGGAAPSTDPVQEPRS